ncbi:carboxynorspermidine decarboxylase [Candidatus Methylomicrobium oryzae]|uniref:carboxynorspermidine decarboxylase n=1 Tax=Candidatus Methylomicrobium oryzae TaxID=2802053 RepID=UPI0019218EE0|nr:carboxynorspermidine decarboxylase [Methylomicrobium sp. RS1]MBL1262312.1 carboxynorspermidine decarboxylase [Methylomicrobium sp. RS1]
MNLRAIKAALPSSPAFVIDRDALLANLLALAELKKHSGVRVLYSIKSLPLSRVLQEAKPYVDGFSVSSLFEARLAREVLPKPGGIHLTTPGLRPDEIEALGAHCTHIGFNSLSQFRRFAPVLDGKVSTGLRVNPKLSRLNDVRFDPCRRHSKLGVPIEDLASLESWQGIAGLHLHNSFSATGYTTLTETLQKIEDCLGDRLEQLEWINLGGGYLYGGIADQRPFIDAVRRLRSRYGVSAYIEPGKAVVGNAGHLIATVLDVFESDGKTVAVLDTSVNHHPEVFEYQRRPDLAEAAPNGGYPAILAGCTCLAGDLFGEYRFAAPLAIGDKVVFKHVGAYSLIKANRFNGCNLPDIYIAGNDGLECVKQFSYEEFRNQWRCGRDLPEDAKKDAAVTV